MPDQVTNQSFPELRSEEVQEIMGQIPPWILRHGITMLFIIIMVLFAGSWFYKYPDIIEAPLVVTSFNPPVQVNARVNGKITQLLVTDKQQVSASDYLAVIENPANTPDVSQLRIRLAAWLEMIHHDRFNFEAAELKQKYELGDMQAPYLGFVRSVAEYMLFVKLDYYPQRIGAIRDQAGKQQEYSRKLQKQYEVVCQQYELAHRQYMRDSLMNDKKMISEAEYDAASISFLQSRYSLESSRIALDNANLQIDQLQQSILDLQLQEMEKQSQLQAEIKTSLDNLQNAFNTWEMTYVLKTPVDGIVDISRYWSVNQSVTTGETVFAIIPEASDNLIGKSQLPIAGSGKVRPGLSVNVRFLNFPDAEYGIVRGVVRNISVVPTGDSYTLEVDFPDGLMTSYGDELPFHHEMYATAEIITEDLRLLERLLLPLKKVFREQSR